MKKILLTLFLLTSISNLIYADDIKDNTTQSISDEEFMKQWEQLEQRQQKAKENIKALDKLEKTIDEISAKLKIDQKKDKK